MTKYRIVPVEPTREMILELMATGLRHAEYKDGCSPTVNEMAQGYQFMLAAAPSPWVSVEERLPAPGTPVLAFYENRIGKGRRICAEYIAPKSRVADQLSDPEVETVEYDEEADEYYWLPGWYERIDNWEEYSHLAVSEGDVTHWMPLPEAPGAKERSK